MKYINTTTAALRLGISKVRVAQLCKQGKIKAVKFGRDWSIDEKDLPEGPWQMKAGRPRKIT